MKWTLPALCCALLLPAGALAAPGRAAADGATKDGAATIDVGDIEVGDWTYVGNSAATMMFIKTEPASAGSAYRRVLVRFEEAKPFDRSHFASMSDVEIDEIDCAQQKTRVIQDTRYAGRNMMGESHVDREDMPVWKTEAKGSFGAGILKAACGDTV